MRVGLIGLGLLGSAIGDRLRGAGFQTWGHDTGRAQRAEFAAAGGSREEPARIFAECSRIVLALPTSEIAAEVLGAHGGSLRSGAVVIDCTTGVPSEGESMGAALAAHGAGYLDATVGGSSKVVRSGEAIAMVGGAREHFDACAPVFDSFCRRAFLLGPCGAGARMKLVFNLALGLHRAVLAEALGVAAGMGLDEAVALEVLRSGVAKSAAMDVKGAKMLARDFEPEARLAQHHKDVRIMLEEGRRTGASLPLTELHDRILSECEANGWGALDNSAVRLAFDPQKKAE